MRVLAENKRAWHDYEIKEKFIAGLILKGFEVKSAKNKNFSINNAYITFLDGKPFLINSQIPPWQSFNVPQNYDVCRNRELLLRRKEIFRLQVKRRAEKLTIIPLRVLEKNNLIKLEIALARKKRKYEKKEKIKDREEKKRTERLIKETSIR